MATTIRPELSDRNKYWIERHRYYELKHFCLQYPIWKKLYFALNGLSRCPSELGIHLNAGAYGNPTARCAEARELYLERMRLVEQTVVATDANLYCYILKGVTEGVSYDMLKLRSGIPCGKDIYYDLYRRFFWLLDQRR